MDFLHIVMPLGDGISIEDIPQDIKDAAKKSVEMWEDYLEEETRRKIEERKREIDRLKFDIEAASLRNTLTQNSYRIYRNHLKGELDV